MRLVSQSPLSHLRFTTYTHPSPIRPPLHPLAPPLEHTPLHLLPHAVLPQALTEIHARGVALGEIRYDSMFITDDAKVSCPLSTSDDYTRTRDTNGAQGNNRKSLCEQPGE